MSELKQRPGDQPLPTPNDRTDIQTMVIADIEERRQVGIQRYGTARQAHNGRDALRDLYEELLDGAMYARQLMEEKVPRAAGGGTELRDRIAGRLRSDGWEPCATQAKHGGGHSYRDRCAICAGDIDGITGAVMAVFQPEIDRLREYENAINWHTSCTSCARMLDAATEERERAELAAERARLAAAEIDQALGAIKPRRGVDHRIPIRHLLAALDALAPEQAAQRTAEDQPAEQGGGSA